MSDALFDISAQGDQRDDHDDAAEEGHPPLLDEGPKPLDGLGPACRRAGLHPALHPGARRPGYAGKLGKADLDPRAIEAMPEGCIAVADAMGVATAGIFGDILTMRMVKRNVAALVTDGVIRDKAGVLASKLPIWCAGVAAPASVNGLTFVGWRSRSAAAAARSFPAT